MSIDELSEFLHKLSDAIPHERGSKIVLSEIRGNCYALNLVTASLTQHKSLQVIHESISKNDFRGLTEPQMKYARRLDAVMKLHNCSVDAYDRNKEWKIKVVEINIPKTPLFYYEIDTVYGIVTAIGGKSLESKSIIHINQGDYPITVTEKQERELLQHFKGSKLEFTVKKKVNLNDDKIVEAVLEDFEVMSSQTFFAALRQMKADNNEGFFNHIEDSVEAVRNLRQGNI